MAFNGITLRRAQPADLDRIRTLTEACPGAPHWSAHTWQQVLQSTSADAQRVVVVAESETKFIGLGVLGRADDTAEIESLAVRSAWRRHGIGRRLCEELLAWARAHGATRASLEVRLSNTPARSLYVSLGFHEAGVRRGYYRDPEEDALVMTKEL